MDVYQGANVQGAALVTLLQVCVFVAWANQGPNVISHAPMVHTDHNVAMIVFVKTTRHAMQSVDAATAKMDGLDNIVNLVIFFFNIFFLYSRECRFGI